MIYRYHSGHLDTSKLTEKEVKEALCKLQKGTRVDIYDWREINGKRKFVKIESCKRSDIYDI